MILYPWPSPYRSKKRPQPSHAIVLAAARRWGYADGFADLHLAPVHLHDPLPRWCTAPNGWVYYLDGWYDGQRDRVFIEQMRTAELYGRAA